MTWLLTLLGGQREPPTVQTIEQPQNKCNHEKHDMNSKKTTSCDLLDCCLKCFRSHNTTPPWHTLKRQLRQFFFFVLKIVLYLFLVVVTQFYQRFTHVFDVISLFCYLFFIILTHFLFEKSSYYLYYLLQKKTAQTATLFIFTHHFISAFICNQSLMDGKIKCHDFLFLLFYSLFPVLDRFPCIGFHSASGAPCFPIKTL